MHASKKLVELSILTIIILGLLSLNATLVLATYQSTTPSNSCKFPAIFNFGDSNSDTGGLSAAFGQVGPPFGETYFHAPAGRHSDGRLIIDFIAESFGLPYLNAFLDSVGSNFTHGVNFATAGSTIRVQNTTAYSPFSLKFQSIQFRDFQNRSQFFRDKDDVFKSLLPSAEYFPEALYTVDIAQNDLTALYFPNNSSDDQIKEAIPDILDQFKTYIKSIYDLGARYFWIHNTGPLGCLPFMLTNLQLNSSQMDPIGCAIPVNEVAQYYNSGLKEAVAQLREAMPLATITYVDIYSIKYDLISQANKYGFKEPLKACCGQGGEYNYNGSRPCGATYMDEGEEFFVGSCENPWEKINWDGAHYTESANQWIFNRFVDGSYSDPPNPLGMACYKPKSIS